MGLLHRKPKPLSPEEKSYRDDTLIVVVTEDTYAPDQYFAFIKARRVRVKVAACIQGHSSPLAILESARALRSDKDFQTFDEFWLLLDTDHWTQASHVSNYMTAIQEARDEGFFVAVSNPCFDLWLLLHHESISAAPFATCGEVGARIRARLGAFNKTRLSPDHYTIEKAIEAIGRAKQLTPDVSSYRPTNPGCQVWALVEKVLTDAILQKAASGSVKE
jgi:hypothetical protein